MMTDFDAIIAEYKAKSGAEKKRISQNFIFGMVCAVILTILFGFLYNTAQIYYILFWISLCIIGVLALVFLVIGTKFSSDKVLFNYLYPKVVADVSGELGREIEYESFVDDYSFIERVGMMDTKSKTFSMKCKLSYTAKTGTGDGVRVEIYDMGIIERSIDNSARMYFDGLYIVYNMPNDRVFQLATKEAETKWEEIVEGRLESSLPEVNTREGVYEHTDSVDAGIDKQFYDLYDYLSENIPEPPYHIGGVPGEVHVAVSGQRTVRNIPMDDITPERVMDVGEKLNQQIEIADDILAHL